MIASELDSGMNVTEIIDEYFQKSGPSVQIIKYHQYIFTMCVRLPIRGVSESVSFEHTKKKVRKRRSHVIAHSSTMDLKIMLMVEREIVYGEDHT